MNEAGRRRAGGQLPGGQGGQGLPGRDRDRARAPQRPNPESERSVWRQPDTYTSLLSQGLLAELNQAGDAGLAAPIGLQRQVVDTLRRYFELDRRERSPTMFVDADLSARFFAVVSQLLCQVTPDVIAAACADGQADDGELQDLLLCLGGHAVQPRPVLTQVDHARAMVQLCYRFSAARPVEAFELDGQAVKPLFAKDRACRYFLRNVLHQRLVWLPVGDGARLRVSLQPAQNAEPPMPTWAPVDLEIALQGASMDLLAGKGGQLRLPGGLAGAKAATLRRVSRLRPVRDRFKNAWLFIDRPEDADDNAEHLYRWVRQHHPEVNAWFMLNRASSDWPRLKQEGFRLLPPGAQRRLAVLNAAHIVSSHTDFEFGGLSRAVYAELMDFKFSFVPHGISKDDASHWLGRRSIDLFVTSSPAEQASIAGEGTPYAYTEREARCLGLPRRDALLRLARALPADEPRFLLVMPTWRGGLVDERSQATTEDQRLAQFASSDYARRWRQVLNHPRLHAAVRRAGLTLAFMAHPNAAPYLSAFGAPAQVRLLTKADTGFMPLLCRSAALVTDYTSVAFDMAYLRRPSFYYQPDRDGFYRGDHNWRRGYFDYDRDGFGPVAFDQDTLVAEIERFVDSGGVPQPLHLARMQAAMPVVDEGNCERVFNAIQAL